MADGSESQRRMLALGYSAGSTLVGPVILGAGIDWLAGTLPWVTIAGVFVGMLGVFVLLIRMTAPKGPSS
ncbi:AtpZ/AtpI family protein [Zavarzinella formosa]|uniref:AtpZ/AtpI family protein n=1 Tax=Zavarzinella formosa TaxID=360055 RepID=UPI0005925447|nr:AtpZ/AtpI family protein [Zavarzinella formosa]